MMARQSPTPTDAGRLGGFGAGVLAVAAAKFLVHILFVGQYGVFRDELYYLDCARHLAWGYVDQPPLIAAMARLTLPFEPSLLALRLPVILAGVALVLLTAALARELGGGRFAQTLAAIGVLAAPGYLLLHHILTMNGFEPLFWVGAAFLVVRYLRTRDERLWIAFGALSGVGLLNKNSMLFMGFALVAGLLLAGEWRVFQKHGVWLGGLLAALLFFPNAFWQASHGNPQLKMLEQTRKNRDIRPDPVSYVKEQVAAMNPVGAILWVGGLGALLASRRLRSARTLGLAYLVLLALFAALRTKVYYLFPVYGVLFAAGGVAFEAWTSDRHRWVRVALPALLLLSGIVTGPVVFPAIPRERFGAYMRAIGLEPPHMEKGRDSGRLPQIFADMHGWDTMAAQVAVVYRTLTPEEQAKACVFGQNYGEAGAINHFGPGLGLPRAISGHNSYGLWGPQGCTGEVLLVIGGDENDNRKVCRVLEKRGLVHNDWARQDENDLPIWVCTLNESAETIWPRLRHID
ncbi:MAG: glycosyltransferase family 39 protein [Vicinamibacteria bacterium]